MVAASCQQSFQLFDACLQESRRSYHQVTHHVEHVVLGVLGDPEKVSLNVLGPVAEVVKPKQDDRDRWIVSGQTGSQVVQGDVHCLGFIVQMMELIVSTETPISARVECSL
jgi:hypothetical protein